MYFRDILKLTGTSVFSNRSRTLLTVLGIAIGIASVVLLTSLGQGVNRYVTRMFTQFGTNLIEITPGNVGTMGGSLGAINTTRPLSIDDAMALRDIPHIEKVVTFTMGNAEVEANRRQRRTTIYGTNTAFPASYSFAVQSGNFLPDDNPHAPRPTAVLGSLIKQELFGNANALGEFIRIAGNRFRVVGVMASKGQMLGVDLDDTVYLPVSRAMEMFNRESLMQISVVYSEGAHLHEVEKGIADLFKSRHGIEDITITTQQQMMDVLGSILSVLTAAVAGIGGISLIVGGIGIMTIMTIAVAERTNEIGLLRALGATQSQIMMLFLSEAVVMAALGGLAGLIIGWGAALLFRFVAPGIPVHTPWLYMLLAVIIAIVIGLLAGVLPARRAAHLLPLEALRAE